MITTLILTLASLVSAHTGAFGPGMYCRGGPTDVDDNNTNTVVNPLGDLTKSDWWFQNDRGCTKKPPPAGEFLELPAGGNFTVELAHNRAFTSLSYEGRLATDWPDGQVHPEDYAELSPGACLTDGALHTNNRTTAAGTAWAISYESDLTKVTMENLVVFSVLEHTPWKRIATYEVPAGLPACPPEGCTCAWLWVPLLCGISNMYMQGFKCNVTGATSTIALAAARAPVMCEEDPTKCVHGAKQMLAWNQKDGNNIVTKFPVAPGYNMKCGWQNGAQNDIFAAPLSPPPASTSSSISIEFSTFSSTAPITTSVAVTTTPIVSSTSSAQPNTSSTMQTTIEQSTSVIKTTIITTTSLSQPTTAKSSSVIKTSTAKTTSRVRTTSTKKTKTSTKRTTTSTKRATSTTKTTRRHRHGRATHHA